MRLHISATFAYLVMSSLAPFNVPSSRAEKSLPRANRNRCKSWKRTTPLTRVERRSTVHPDQSSCIVDDQYANMQSDERLAMDETAPPNVINGSRFPVVMAW